MAAAYLVSFTLSGGYRYTKGKISRNRFHADDAILHGVLNDGLYHRAGHDALSYIVFAPAIREMWVEFHHGFTAAWFAQRVETALHCFPVVLLLQVLWVGPLARRVFRLLFAWEKQTVNP